MQCSGLDVVQADGQNSMGARAVRVGSGTSGGPGSQPVVDDTHELMAVLQGHLLQSGNHHLLLCVLTSLKRLALIQQVVELPTVDLVEGNHHLQVRVGRLVQQLEQVPRGQHENTRNSVGWVIPFPHGRPHHGVGLPTPRLSVGKAGALPPADRRLHKGLHAGLIQALVADVLIETSVKSEDMPVHKAGKVHFDLGLQNRAGGPGALEDVVGLGLEFLPAPGPFPDHDLHPRVAERLHSRP
mmetsp:Transcript_43974/g.100512  ORF Transcript_43974/g.100512 Transcript_43974/m.100512 type:complete len:241 (-) Transcript_43974:140-862(-)